MRDLILLVALLGVFPLILRAPQIGILTWIWLTLMNPQQEVYGFLGGFQLNFYIAILTAFAWVFSRERKTAPLNLVTALLVLFGIWISITTYYALQRDFSYVLWDRTIKTLILAVAILAITNTKARIQAVVWVTVLSLAYFGVKGGGFVLLTGGAHRVYGPPNSMIEDNNALGLALVMILPFINYLRITSRSVWLRFGLLAAMVLTIMAVIGTYSRGALFALGVSGLAYAIKSRSSIIPLILGGLVIISLPTLVPSTWFQRMSTIQAYNSDSSFEGRVAAWKTSFNIAKARPTGGGFSSVNLDWVAQAYESSRQPEGGQGGAQYLFRSSGRSRIRGIAAVSASGRGGLVQHLRHTLRHPRPARTRLGDEARAHDAGEHHRIPGGRFGPVDGLL